MLAHAAEPAKQQHRFSTTPPNSRDSLMHKPDFIHAMEGKPWRDRACSFDAADCWGLVVLYYRHVLGIEIHQTPDYEAGSDFLTCFPVMSCSGIRPRKRPTIAFLSRITAVSQPTLVWSSMGKRFTAAARRVMCALTSCGRWSEFSPNWSFTTMPLIEVQRVPGLPKERHNLPAGSMFYPPG